jgi:hypothetical protein
MSTETTDIVEQLRIEAGYRKDEMDPTLLHRAAVEIGQLRALLRSIAINARGQQAPSTAVWKLEVIAEMLKRFDE